MLTRDQARSIAAKMDNKFLHPNIIGEGNKILRAASGQMVAKAGTHKTNGKVQHVVHITFPDHTEAPFTISARDDARIPHA